MHPDKALFRAIDEADATGVRAALHDGADLDARRRHNTPLLDAVFARNPEIVGILARAGARMVNVPDSRDPLREAFTQGDLPTLAALLDVEPTPQALALHFLQDPNRWIHDREVRRSLLRTPWAGVFRELVQRLDFEDNRMGGRWWLSACESYSPDPASIQALLTHATPTNNPSYFNALATNGMPICVMQALQQAGHLDGETMFNLHLGTTTRGFLEAALGQSHNPMKSLRWLMRQAAKLPGGQAILDDRAETYMAYCLGRHASMPLAGILAKAVGEDPIALAAQGRIPTGDTTLHLLLHGYQDMRRRLRIAEQLLLAGADPMQKNNRGIPACYRACLIDGFGTEPLELMALHGADLDANGVVEQALERDQDVHINHIHRAMERLRRHQVEAQHARLHGATPQAPRQKPATRL